MPFLMLLAMILSTGSLTPATAEENTDTSAVVEEAFSLNDLDEEDAEAPAAEKPHPHAARLAGPAGINLSLAVDWTVEAFMGDRKEFTFSSNHEYIMASIAKGPLFRFTAEIVDMTFWEFVVNMPGGHRTKVGKIPVPFGPLFVHQIMGGVVEKPLPGGGSRKLMVPQNWAEYGIEYDYRFYDGDRYGLLGKFWITNGLTGIVNTADSTVDFTAPPGKRDNNLDKGLGMRIENTFLGLYGVNFSVYTCKWTADEYDTTGALIGNAFEGDRMLIGNLDVSAGYGFINIPVLRNLALTAEYALIRTHSTDQAAWVAWHSKIATLLQLRYKLPARWGFLQLRHGLYDDSNAIANDKDLVNYNLAWNYKIIEGVSVIPMYMWNREKMDEMKDDFFFIKFFLEL